MKCTAYFMAKFKYNFFFLCTFFITGCFTTQLKPIPAQTLPSSLGEYTIQSIDLDFFGRCKILFKRGKKKQSGSCSIYLTRQKQMGLSVYDPFGGTVLDVFMNKEVIQVVNRFEKTFHELKNTVQNRTQVLGMDLKISDFQSILWGRNFKSNRKNLNFRFKNGKPYIVTKESKSQKIKVKFKKWHQHLNLWFPKVLKISETRKKSAIILGITEFIPGKLEGVKELTPPEGFKVYRYKRNQ